MYNYNKPQKSFDLQAQAAKPSVWHYNSTQLISPETLKNLGPVSQRPTPGNSHRNGTVKGNTNHMQI